MTEVIKLAKDDTLIREGDKSTQMYYLQTGTLAVLKKRGTGPQQIGTITAGELVGEMSFLDKEPRSATVKAITDCELVEIPHEKFENFLKTMPNWYQALVHTLLDRLRRADAKIKI